MFKKGVQTIVLLALLVVFPLLSWLYLQRGLDYRINAREQIKAKGQLPSQIDWADSTLISIVFDEDRLRIDQLNSVSRHFAYRKDVIFRGIDYAEPTDLMDSLSRVARNVFPERRIDVRKLIFLINPETEIVGAYDPESEEGLVRLAEHIVFLLPPEEKRDFEFRREKEK